MSVWLFPCGDQPAAGGSFKEFMTNAYRKRRVTILKQFVSNDGLFLFPFQENVYLLVYEKTF